MVVAVVGDDRAVKAPLVAQDAGQQRLTAACPDCADTVVAAHEADCVVILDEHPERAQVGLAQGLLRHPGIDGIAVDTALAVVADKVLDIGVDARLVCAGHSVAADDAGQQAVLGIILIVAAIEGAAVHVGGGGIPAGVAVLQGLRADGAALLLGKVCVPGLGQRAGAGEARAGTHAGEAADLGGAVGVLALGLADALEFGQAAVGVDVEVFHLVNGQLIQQGIPPGVVEVRAEPETEVGGLAVVLDLQAVLSAGGNSLISVVDPAVGIVGGVAVQHLDVVGHGTGRGVRLGEGARKVGAGQVGDVLVGITAVEAHAVNGVAAGKLVGNGIAGDGVLGILHACGQAAGDGRIGVVVHIVGIMAHGEDVVTRIQLIAGEAVVVGVVGIVAGHVGDGDRQGDLLALAGGQLLRLGERAQLDAGFFNFPCRVRGGVVELDNVLARAVTGVRDGNIDGHITVLRQGAAVGGVRDFPIKAGVAQAVAEGILHNGVVAGAVLVALGIPVALCVGGLVPLVADVDALGVIDIGNLLIGVGRVKVAVRRAVCRVEAVGVAVLTDTLYTGVRIAGGGGQVISPGIGGTPAGFAVTPQHFGHGSRALGAGQTGNQAGINAGDRLDLAQLHDIGGVDEHNHMGVICADVVQQILFLGGQLQHRAGVVNNDVAALLGALVLLLGGVVALARQTPDHDNSRIGEALGVVQHRLCIVGPVVDVRLIQAAGLLGPGTQGAGVLAAILEILVHIGQLGVVRNAVGSQRGQQIGVDAGHAAGAGTAAQPGSGGPAKDVDLLVVSGQRQGVVVVPDKDSSLGLNISGQRFRLDLGVGNFSVGIVAAGCADEAVNDGGHRGQNVGADQYRDQQDH